MDTMTSYNVLGSPTVADNSLIIRNENGEVICHEHIHCQGPTFYTSGTVDGKIDSSIFNAGSPAHRHINYTVVQEKSDGNQVTYTGTIIADETASKASVLKELADRLGLTVASNAIAIKNVKAFFSNVFKLTNVVVSKTDGGHPWLGNKKPASLDGLVGSNYYCYKQSSSGHTYFYSVTVWERQTQN